MIHQAMLKGEVDLYPEYSGTAYMTVLKKPLPTNQENIFEKVRSAYYQDFHLVWLDPFGFSNSQSLAIPIDYAKKHHIYSLSDLARVSPPLRIAAPPEFLKRPDAFPGLCRVYGLTFNDVMQVDPILMYGAIENKKVDVIAAFTTDGKLLKYNLVTLVDDKKFYPSYEVAPVIRQSILKAYPQIYQALAPLLGLIDQEKMKSLNYQVDGEGQSPAEVARHFLFRYQLL
jgi:glycine betaine/choline ABC-type transport system substrate-binding protein